MTGDADAVREPHLRRHDLGADRHHEGAARREPAALWRVEQVRRLARDHLERPPIRLQVRERVDELARVGVARLREHPPDRPFLGDAAGQIFVFFILTVAAAESAIGLAILVTLFRNLDTVNVEDLDSLKG